MKFLKENWFKLMTGTSMLVFSFAFLLYVVSPTYANQTSENKTPEMESNDDAFSVASGGYLYHWDSRNDMKRWSRVGYENKPTKRKLP
ncbi:hypothetical protein N8203_01835 [Crocinitomicaceae bacterium]|nr:hypothetical protein [Crocinitomicaceae bacterium]